MHFGGQLVLFGGICQEPMTNMATFETNFPLNSGKYRVLESAKMHGLEKVKGVFGFGSCCYKGKMYYFFGGLGFNHRMQVRLCTSQALEFDPETCTFA